MIPILIIASRAGIAGGENYLLLFLRHIDRSLYSPIVWLPGTGELQTALEAMGVEYVVGQADYGWLQPERAWDQFLTKFPERVRRLASLIEERGVRLVHTNSNKILEGAAAARLAGVPHLYLAHAEFQSEMPIYERFKLDRYSFAQLLGDMSSGIVAVSRRVRDALCPPLEQERVTVINNGLEMARYDAATLAPRFSVRHALGISPSNQIIVGAGRISPEKGFDLLVDAASKVCNDFPSAVFLICGSFDSQDEFAKLSAQVERLGLVERVRFLGRRDDLPELLAASDIFVLSSRREGHPYVLLEAMACNLPSVATCCGGVDETLLDGQTGYVVPIGDSEILAERISCLLEDKDLRERMGRAAGKHVREHFTAAKSADGLSAMYAHLLANYEPSPGAYTVDFFLDAMSEYGRLGRRISSLEDRLAQLERSRNFIIHNKLTRALRKLVS